MIYKTLPSPMIWFGSFQLTNSGRTLLAGDAFTYWCRNTLLLLILFRTTGCQACFLKTIFHIASLCLIWRAAPCFFLAHGQPHGSGQLFLFCLAVVAPQKYFYSCVGKHTLFSFPRVKKQAEYSLCCLANKREICTGSCWQWRRWYDEDTSEAES